MLKVGGVWWYPVGMGKLIRFPASPGLRIVGFRYKCGHHGRARADRAPHYAQMNCHRCPESEEETRAAERRAANVLDLLFRGVSPPRR